MVKKRKGKRRRRLITAFTTVILVFSVMSVIEAKYVKDFIIYIRIVT